MLTQPKVLLSAIRDAMREQSKSGGYYENQKDSRADVMIAPYCEEADDWLGGLSIFGDEEAEDTMIYGWSFRVHPSTIKMEPADAFLNKTTVFVEVYHDTTRSLWCTIRLEVTDVLLGGASHTNVDIVTHTRDHDRMRGYFDQVYEVISDFFRNEREDFAVAFYQEK